MVCREHWSRDQCSISWISEGDILCKFVSCCVQASQLVNGTGCTTALFTRSLQSTHLSPCILSLYPFHCLIQLSSQPTVALIVIKDPSWHKLIQCKGVCTHPSTWLDPSTQQNLWSPGFWSHYSTQPSNPFLWFLSFYTITLHWSFYTYYTRGSPPKPLILWYLDE